MARDENLLTVAEVAELLRVGTATVYRLAKQGKLPGVIRIASAWRFKRDAVLAFTKAARPPEK